MSINILDLALKIPKSFDDYTISKIPNDGLNCVLVKIISLNSLPKFLDIKAFCISWNEFVNIRIFNPKRWHYSVFKGEVYIYAKSIFYNGSYQFINPKIITKIDKIIPYYKDKIKDDKLNELIKKYVTKSNLLSCGLNSLEVDTILNLQRCDKNSIKLISNLKNDQKTLKILSFIEIFNYLLKLKDKKIDFKAQKIEVNDIKNFLKSLPFKPTSDQLNAIKDIKKDFLSGVAKRRVVMGDVGSGKTLVILSAALMCYPNKSYLMVPTTILAEQIYANAKKLLPSFMKILLLKSGEKNINFDDFDFVISTHSLLFHTLNKASLIMIDEQHRFGSSQREKINQLTKDGEFRAHFIQFSATPIPRTMAMIESELVNFSFLKQMPFKKKIVSKVITNSDFKDLIEHIKKQIKKNLQTIIVYPLIEESKSSKYQSLNQALKFWQENFKNVYITHGRDKIKDEVILNFKKNGDILLSTSVIEVGISLPRLSTIVIVGAERLGLASLHQLRGRVARLGGMGWCFLYTKLKEIPKRLIEFCKTQDGFEIAKLDLKNRLSGDLINGTLQHGSEFKFYNYEEDILNMAKKRIENLTSIYKVDIK